MGPKKAVPAKKKTGSAENGGELTPEEKVKMYMLTCQSLQVQLGKIIYINVYNTVLFSYHSHGTHKLHNLKRHKFP